MIRLKSSSAEPLPFRDPRTGAVDFRRIPGLQMLIPDRLAFVSRSALQIAKLTSQLEGLNAILVSFDLHRQYVPLVADFGPVNLAILHRFCFKLSDTLASHDGMVIYWMDTTFEARSNACYLLSAYMVLAHGWTPQDAEETLLSAGNVFNLRKFRDASCSPNSYELTILDCLHGLAKAVKLGWYSISDFDIELFEALDHPCSGEVHSICPKFVAFKGPLAQRSHHRRHKEVVLTPEQVAPALRRLGVSCILRLNQPDTYDSHSFIRAGFRHEDLYQGSHDDYRPPSDDVVERFLDICDRERRLAVHCRAGLGQTGTLIGVWMMKHAGFTANEAIAWLRIVRPGCVVGPQQHYLKSCERRPWAGNRLGPASAAASSPPPSPSHEEAMRPLPAEHVRRINTCLYSYGARKVRGLAHASVSGAFPSGAAGAALAAPAAAGTIAPRLPTARGVAATAPTTSAPGPKTPGLGPTTPGLGPGLYLGAGGGGAGSRSATPQPSGAGGRHLTAGGGRSARGDGGASSRSAVRRFSPTAWRLPRLVATASPRLVRAYIDAARAGAARQS